MTVKGDQGYIDALLRERAGHESAGRSARVDQVDAELKRVGGSVPRAGRRGSAPAASSSAAADDQIEA